MDEKTFVITSIPTGLQVLLKDLDFLAQIPRGFKPCIRSRDFVDSKTWGGAIYRFFKGENRSDLISETEKIVERSVDAIKSHKETDYIKIIITYFYRARSGVANLLSTYKDDPEMISRINVQLTNMDIQIKRYQKYIDAYKQDKPIKEENNTKLELEDSLNSRKIKKSIKLKNSMDN